MKKQNRLSGSGKEMTKMSKRKENLIALCETALMIALAVMFDLLDFPPFTFSFWANGGSIDFVMLPIIVLGWRRGLKWSLPAGALAGLLTCIITGGIGWGIPSILLDYVLAYGMVGLAGLFKGKKWGLILGTVVASCARFAVHFIAGVTIWKIAVGDSMELFGMTFDSNAAYLYSLVYNGSFMLGDLLYCLGASALIMIPLLKMQNKRVK